MKGTPTEPGKESPYRNRSVEENLDLFEKMRNGAFEDGSRTLRAKLDMTSPNMQLRDPVMYRIKRAHHHRTGNQWMIYPLYDFAHGQSDSIENVTHSICTLEFVPHRPLYDWFIEQLEIFPSRQYEFARLNLNYTVMSKRKLLKLVNEKFVSGWDDPRMPTISGMRRRGYTAESIRNFCERIGVAKRDNMIDVGLLEFFVREHLNKIALRRMVVFDPLKVVITNYPEGETETIMSEENPEDPSAPRRAIPFSRELYIEKEDFMEEPPKKFFRLSPGKMVRLKSAYIIRCDEVIKNENGELVEIRCSYLPESKSGNDTSGISVKGTLHWVSVPHAEKVELRLYDRLFRVEDPSNEEADFEEYINPHSLGVVHAFAEPVLQKANLGERYQFLRKGYFYPDKDSVPGKLVFNRTATLKDTWEREKLKVKS
jgi:glutaminyl-tRNA synthetase